MTTSRPSNVYLGLLILTHLRWANEMGHVNVATGGCARP